MIAKPRDWDSAQAYTGESAQVAPGGHIVRIMSAYQEPSRAGKPMIVVRFDIEEGGPYDGHYKRLYQARKAANPNATWGGVIRFMLYGKDGMSTNGFFKGFIASVEASNEGYHWDWDECSLSGKLVGMVFGEEEYEGNDGQVRTSVKAQQARSVQTIRDGVPVPPKKCLRPAGSAPAPFNPAAGFTRSEDEDLPF